MTADVSQQADDEQSQPPLDVHRRWAFSRMGFLSGGWKPQLTARIYYGRGREPMTTGPPLSGACHLPGDAGGGGGEGTGQGAG